MKTIELTEPVAVTPTSLRALVARVETARQTLARAWATASEVFRDIASEPAAEVERWRSEWRNFEPASASQQLHKQTRRLVVAARTLHEALGAMQDVLAEGEAALVATRANVEQIRASATSPRQLAEAAELEVLARDLVIALAASEDETFRPASRLAALVAAALPRAVGAALRVLREQHVARATSQLAELRRRAESLREPWPGESELIALGAEAGLGSGAMLVWPDDLLAPPRLSTDG